MEWVKKEKKSEGGRVEGKQERKREREGRQEVNTFN